MRKPLSNKELTFCYMYVTNGCNAKEAAESAGYKTPEKAGANVAARPRVQARIRALQNSLFMKAELNAEMMINELAVIAFSDIRNYVTVDESGIRVHATNEMGIKAKAIESIKIKEKVVKRNNSDEEVIDRNIEVKLWNKNKALETLMTHYENFQNFDKNNLNGNNQVFNDSYQRTKERIKEMKDRLKKLHSRFNNRTLNSMEVEEYNTLKTQLPGVKLIEKK